MASYRSSFGDLLEPGFREIFDDVYKEMPEVYPQLFHVNSSSKQDEKDSAVSGFGLMQQTNEGGQVDYEDPVPTRAAYARDSIGKLLKLRETLPETIRSQAKKSKDSLEGSETIIGASFLGWWDSPNYTAMYRVR